MIGQVDVMTERREEILAAAADIFWEKGYHATSMNDVAGAMSIRKASLYHHISSKEALLHEISVSSMRHITDALESISETDPELRLREIVVGHVKTLLGDRSWHATGLVELRSLLPEQRKEVVGLRSKYESLVDQTLQDVQQKTGRWPGVPIRVVRMALLGMLNWTVFWFDARGPQTAESVAESFYAIFMPPTVK